MCVGTGGGGRGAVAHEVRALEGPQHVAPNIDEMSPVSMPTCNGGEHNQGQADGLA